MKNIFLTRILTICFSTIIISCSKDNTNNPDSPNNGKIFLTKQINNEPPGGTHTLMYFYDNSSRLKKETVNGRESDFIYNEDGTLNKMMESDNNYVEKYNYKNNKIESIIYIRSYVTDTLFLFYDSDGKIERTVIYGYNGANIKKDEMIVNYSVDNKGRVTRRIDITKKYSSDNVLWRNEIDTIYFEYSSNGNLISNNRYAADLLTNEKSWKKNQFEYDTKMNYWQAKHFPVEDIFIKMLYPIADYSINNIILSTFTSSSGDYNTDIYTITNYNSMGYPLSITTDGGASVELQYSENIVTN